MELPKGWAWKRLGDVTLKFINGGTPSTAIPEYWNGSIQWTTSKSITSCTINAGEKFISQEAIEKSSANVIPKDNVLIASRVGIGKSAVNLIDIAISQDLTGVILDKKRILPEFLVRYLHNPKVLQALESNARGSTIKGLQRSDLERIEISLPPLPIQNQIVAVLEQAEAVSRQRLSADSLTGALLQSVFLEMFGDPVRNEKRWPLMKMKEVCTKVTDGTHDTPTPTATGIPFVLGRHIRDRIIDFDNADYLPKNIHDEVYRRCNPEFGDVILVHIGNIGTAAYVNVKFEFSMKNIALLKPNPKIIHGRFLETYLIQIKPYIEKIVSRGGIQRFLSIKEMEKIPCIAPPLALQQQFARIVEDVGRIRERQVASGKEIDGLCEGLMQRAFSGELSNECS